MSKYMNNKEYVSRLSRKTGYKSDTTKKLLQTMVTIMGDSFMEGNSLQVQGFGTFEVKKKMERIIVNPSSGQRMLVPPKLVLGFKAASSIWKVKEKNVAEDETENLGEMVEELISSEIEDDDMVSSEEENTVASEEEDVYSDEETTSSEGEEVENNG